MRCIPGNKLSLEGLVGRLIAFELSNFDNYKHEKIDSSFKAKVTLKEPNEKKKKRRILLFSYSLQGTGNQKTFLKVIPKYE